MALARSHRYDGTISGMIVRSPTMLRMLVSEVDDDDEDQQPDRQQPGQRQAADEDEADERDGVVERHEADPAVTVQEGARDRRDQQAREDRREGHDAGQGG